MQFSGFGIFGKSTKSWIEKIHFCEVRKIFDFAKMKIFQKLQKKWKTNASNGYRPIIAKKIFFRPKAGNTRTTSHKTTNIDQYIFC